MAAGERALAPGTEVRGFWIEALLGEGGFGVTYKVRDVSGNIYAMKELFPEKMAVRGKHNCVIPKPEYAEVFPHFCENFENEAQTIYAFQDHPNIIDVVKLFRVNNTVYYVMECLDGCDLGRYLKKKGGKLSWDALRPIMRQMVEALDAVHRKKLVHCDVSPDNIFVLRDGSAKLIDFGATKSLVQKNSSEVFLKRGFAPPEQMEIDGKIGPWTDVYALAVTIYKAYTGKMPPESVERCRGDRTVWPSEMGIPLPSSGWEYALRRAMAIRVEDRYQNVREFWEDLAGPEDGNGFVLEGVQGEYRGQRIRANRTLILGRDASKCSVPYPTQTPGVSAQHLCVWVDDGTLYAMDMNSTYGTWCGNRKMLPGLCYPLRPEDTLFFGANQMFRVTQDNDMTHRIR